MVFFPKIGSNHFLFFKGKLLEAIERDFGSFDEFKSLLTARTVAVQGSGWGWLVRWTCL